MVNNKNTNLKSLESRIPIKISPHEFDAKQNKNTIEPETKDTIKTKNNAVQNALPARIPS